MAKDEVKEVGQSETEVLEDFRTRVAEILRARHDNLIKALNQEMNIANRYELRVRIEEVVAIYNDIFAPVSSTNARKSN